MNNITLVRVKAGSIVHDLNKERDFISKTDFTGKLVQAKCGFLYYKMGSKRFRVSREQAAVVIDQSKMAHAAL